MKSAFWAFGIAATVAAVTPLSDARAAQERKAEPTAPLVSVLSDEDYPASAIRNGEQGSVSFRLSVGADGGVAGCEVLVSSGSTALDSTTCRLMVTRVRFRAARNSSDKPVPGFFEGRIVWRLPTMASDRIDLPERPSAAIRLWSTCADGEAAKLIFSTLAAAEIAARAFGACIRLEERVARELEETQIEDINASRTVQALKEGFAERVGPWVDRTRSVLGPKKPSAGQPEVRPPAGE
jgi:TonB family protein